MPFDPVRAAIRFGCGLSPKIAAPRDAGAMLDTLTGPDRAAARFPIGGFEVVSRASLEIAEARRQLRKADNDADREAVQKLRLQKIRALRDEAAEWFRHMLLRRALTEDGFRERLTFFWADHFTAQGGNGVMGAGHLPYIDEAIRPHVAGRFADMLKAVVTHPLMLIYLDQRRSMGPNSAMALRRKNALGLNENLARELMELHTLGVDGPYAQDDVRDLAKLLTGLSYRQKTGFTFRDDFAEPGVRVFLGGRYGGEVPTLARVYEAMEALAAHPATAAHLARKLAVHFTGDAPDAGMVQAMTEAYVANDGALLPVYAAMLEHPGAWHDGPGNVKQPIDFVGSTLRALDIVPRHVPRDRRALQRHVMGPMVLMGQIFGAPLGPDGWPEDDAAWITPQRMAARLQWGMTVPFKIKRLLPDPREFVETALGPGAPEAVRFAAKAAETRAEGVGVVLASPAFHRM